MLQEEKTMKRIAFDYDVKIIITISGRELYRLQELAELHYDAICKAAGRHGGFLYGCIVQWILDQEDPKDHQYCFRKLANPLSHKETNPFLNLADDDILDREIEITVTGGQIGTLAKIGEVEDHHHSPIYGFTFQFQQMLTERNAEYFRIC